MRDALAQEFELGKRTLGSGESVRGAQRFSDGTGRHGRF
jgi:enoyl-CoA hydratase